MHAGIARTFQNLRLFTDLTALDNVMVGIAGQFGEEPVGAIFRPLHTARAQRGAGRRRSRHWIMSAWPIARMTWCATCPMANRSC